MSYGTDIYCFDRLQTGRFVSGSEVVAQALYRRLTTPRGTLRDGDEGSVYGFDVMGFVGLVGNQAALDALPDAVIAECLKDDRVSSLEVVATGTVESDGTMLITLTIDVFLHDSEDTFTLTLSVSNVTVALLGITVQ